MGRVIHFEIQAADPDRAERFYTSVFGWSVQPVGGPMDYRLLVTGDDGTTGINGAILRRGGPPPGDRDAVNGFICTIAVDSIADTERAVPEADEVTVFGDSETAMFAALWLADQGKRVTLLSPPTTSAWTRTTCSAGTSPSCSPRRT